jgi:dinuclear metal center YbgI/SA1388 family protein
LAEAFNLDKAAGWDPVGLQLGDPERPAAMVAVCHELTADVVDRLIESGVDLAVTYHPLLFRPTQSLVAGRGSTGRAFRLISAGVAVLVTHTAYDVAPGGTADSLAAALDLTGCTGFGPAWGRESVKIVSFAPAKSVPVITKAMAGAGAGTIGRYHNCSYRSDGVGSFLPRAGAVPAVGDLDMLGDQPETRFEMIAPEADLDRVVAALIAAHPYEEPAYDVVTTRSNAGFIGRRGDLDPPVTVAALAHRVAARIGGVVRVAGEGIVRSVAVIPGSGGSMLGAVDADVIVTGDVSHHQARDALARGVAVIDPGHAATERPGVQSLYAAVAQLAGEAIDMTDVDADPWKER